MRLNTPDKYWVNRMSTENLVMIIVMLFVIVAVIYFWSKNEKKKKPAVPVDVAPVANQAEGNKPN